MDSEARRAAGMMVAPLRTDGVDVLKITSEGRDETITKSDVDSFDTEDLGELALENTAEELVQIVSLSFDPSLKWRFYDGFKNFTAEILDAEFWSHIENHLIQFSEGDRLRVLMRRRTFSRVSDGRLK